MKYLKKLLLKAIEMVDNGECDHMSPEELEEISNIIHRPVTMGREDAAKYIGVSLNRFHELIASGIIREPRKRLGFKEKEYFLADLKEAKERILHITHL